MRKKKILFSCYGLGFGGIEKCLINLLEILPQEEFIIDLLLMNPEFDLKEQLSNKVTLIKSEEYVFNSEDTWEIKRNQKGRIFNYCMFRILNKAQYKPWIMFKKMRKKYDVAVAYSHNDFSPYYIIDKVCAEKKYLWYHNGSYEKKEKAYILDKQYYSKFNNLVTVSQDAKQMLQQYFPELSKKILVMHNIINTDEIIEKSKESIEKAIFTKQVNVLTVGRLTKEKGVDLALNACSMLVKAGYDLGWYWIGDGNQRDVITKEIKKLNLEKHFILLGNRKNPYKYMRRCDVYVQPSHYEAYCTTTNEARVLNKAVVTTDVGGMKDQFESGRTGFIVEKNSRGIFDAIRNLIDDPLLKQRIENNLQENHYQFNEYINEYKELFGLGEL